MHDLRNSRLSSTNPEIINIVENQAQWLQIMVMSPFSIFFFFLHKTSSLFLKKMLVNIHFCESQVQLPNEIWWKFAKLIRSTRKNEKKRLFPFETFNLVRNIIYFWTFSYVEKKFCICAQNGKMQFYYWWNSRSILDYTTTLSYFL